MEQDEFLKEFDQKDEQFGGAEEVITEDKKEEDNEEGEDGKKNRRERRLEAKYQAERESSIALAARLEAMTEAQKFRSETEPKDYEKLAERIYGTETPEAVAATNLLREALKGVHQSAKEEAINEFKEEQRQAAQAVKKEEETLDSMIEELEDEYNVTIDKATSSKFFGLLEKLSPKDSEGNVIQFADHHAVWEQMQMSKKPDNRAKEMAARTMVRSGGESTENLQVSVQEKFLRDNGII